MCVCVCVCVCVDIHIYIYIYIFICKILLHFEELAEVIVRADEPELCKAVWPTRNSCGRWCFILEAEFLLLWWRIVFVLKAIKELWGSVPLFHDNLHTMEYYSAIKKWNFAICKNMDGNKSNRERQILYDITYMWNLENMMN